ncbi:hypothetical protein ABIB73_003967 [Bradyrhizobium sp. F1.4.3]|uniref:hypothetical protein n=1 Tax=Bradyrhizobium sp. F1.4.3 TaxID=3156356 RepID=UPI0033929A36
MLSRLISLLCRIPAVQWAFTRLRPLPRSGSIDVAPIAAAEQSTTIVDIADAVPALDTSNSIDPLRNDADIAVAGDDTTISVTAESPSAAPSDSHASDDSSRVALPEIEPVVEDEASVLSDVDSEPADVPELVISSEPSAELPTDVEPVVAEEISVSSVDVETAPVDVLDIVIDEDPSPSVLENVEPAVASDSCAALVGAEVSAADAPEINICSEPSPSVAVEIAPVLANDPPPIATVAAEDSFAATVAASIEPSPALASPSPEIRSAPKARARAAEPVDRTTLIRQRWAETGIRMWNPRLHGAGDATLNIQGSVELLPPAPGETMPRYDKLEFKMLGGHIVCEGVIVEAPAQADKRSFTRLAEPGKPDRVREPLRERQAALA